MTRSSLRLPLLAVLALAACGGHDGLTVNGQVTAAGGLGDFHFATDTKLYGDESTPPNGVIAGHCTITRGVGGNPDKLDLGIQRTGVGPTDLGLSQLRIAIDDATPTHTRGTVAATFGQTDTYAGGPGTGGCDVSFLYDAQDKTASFTLGTCNLVGASGTRSLSGQLQYYECTVE